jgi:hypothetical protein
MAVNDVERKQQRNAMRRLLDRNLLQFVYAKRIEAASDETDLATPNPLFDVSDGSAGAGGVRANDVGVIELTDLFGQAHAL